MKIIKTSRLNRDLIDIDVPEDHVFLGNCHGVALLPRGKDDNRICFSLLTEDDGQWFTPHHGSSSYWLGDMIEQLERAKSWMENNAVKDPKGFGYTFK